MRLRNTLICSLVISFAAGLSSAQQGQPPKEAREKEPQLINADYHFIFDRYDGSQSLKHRKQSLDAFALQLHANKNLYGYIVSSAGRISYPGEAGERARALKRYLVGSGGMRADRIKIVDGGYCEQWEITLWWGVEVPPSLWPGSSCYLDPKEVKVIKKRRDGGKRSPAVKLHIQQ
ncbi:MAG TPA: hypothetical protein VF723_14485 [Pyrinomonadaceae bacterium]|jgi:hypothetical protein